MVDETPSRPSPPPLGDDCALFLDVDGTLVEFQEDPAAVHLLPDVREAIGRLSRRLHGALALVSGRPLAQLDALFAPLRLPAAGLHGHQFRHGGDSEPDLPDDTSALLHELHCQAARMAATRPGVLVEDKGVSLALHWRAAPEFGPEVAAFARAQIGNLPGYRLQPGDHVVEFVPASSDKGQALERMMAQPAFRGRVPVFIGDDLTDEYGFAAANRAGGWSVLVGDREPSEATYALPRTRDVHAWLIANAAQREVNLR
ncbi:trehalose-phosphatase [Pseudoxanthomonas suwonensis]|jgi:trehalose-phosphatase|uniref:trehalose-phosphatase n=1 Tax=Pseudoxanthomonas suwonensis TaxID=314722 RepID=UPI00138EC9EC|nr:trehalose-phosphatase [Pseudoxanthomonas suwonensis]KAF1698828.1 trehalose-phosphatase [Pseudoxanthomonas suwonensis]